MRARGLCGAHYKAEARAEGRLANPKWDTNRKAAQQKRRALKRGVTVETVIAAEVFERDGWVCRLCFHAVDRGLKWPDSGSPSLDHIVPISLGGEHSYANTQLAHLGCNSSKGNRTFVHAGAMLV